MNPFIAILTTSRDFSSMISRFTTRYTWVLDQDKEEALWKEAYQGGGVSWEEDELGPAGGST
jgi:hypothetical protein